MEKRPASPLVLVILDGWGVAPRWGGNAIALARTPTISSLARKGPHAVLEASGRAVGLPGFERGNSETGHLNLGAGRIVWQDFSLITKKIEDESFFETPAFLSAFQHVRNTGGTLHLLGLVSDSTVHSHIDHLLSLLDLAMQKQIERVAIHAITDGRDTDPVTAERYLKKVDRKIEVIESPARVATLCGRYWAMDRDNRWDRTERAYRALVHGQGERKRTWRDALSDYYAKGTTDEFIPPTILGEEGTAPTTIRSGDSVIFFNFRADRARQLTKVFVLPEFAEFPRGKKLKDLFFVTLVNYEESLPHVAVAFEPERVHVPIAEVLSQHEYAQFHIAETEKYAHVTYFFNGGREKPYPGEERILIPSARVATYDQKPEMSAVEIADGVVSSLEKGSFDFVVANFANADMVGHTGNIAAAIRACEVVDACVGVILEKTRAVDATLLVTGDHGNAEEMINPTSGEPDTEHSKNPVPFLLDLAGRTKRELSRRGKLADVAPTILELMGIEKPPEMTGTSLLK